MGRITGVSMELPELSLFGRMKEDQWLLNRPHALTSVAECRGYARLITWRYHSLLIELPGDERFIRGYLLLSETFPPRENP